MASDQRMALAAQNTERLMDLLQQNTELTEITKQLSQRIEMLALEIHGKIMREDTKP